jgi:hypothetical protein
VADGAAAEVDVLGLEARLGVVVGGVGFVF